MSDTNRDTGPLNTISTNTDSGSILTSAPKSTGIKGDIPLGPDETEEILARMQAFIDQRESPLSLLMGGINKAYATTYGPGAALEYQRQQDIEDKQIMDYRNQMAAYRSAQKQADLDAADYAQKMKGRFSIQAAQPGAGMGTTASGAPTWDGIPIPDTVIARLKEGKANIPHNRAVIADWLKTSTEKATSLAYSPEMRKEVTIMFEGEPLTMRLSDFDKYAENNPKIARAIAAQRPEIARQLASARGAGGAGAGAAPTGAGAAPTREVRPATVASGKFDFSGLPTSFPTPTVGGVTGSSKQGYEANVKLAGDIQAQSMSSFMKNTYDKLAEKVAVQEDDVMIANDALDAIKTGNYGPGSGINQAIMRAAKALGIKESEEAAQQYLNNLTISRVKELFKASGARAAMGAQFTAQEAENFGKTLADITDPKEYIKAVYQVKVAMAEINAAKKAYLDAHPNNMPAANAAWEQSGKKRQMLIDRVDYLREREERKSGKGGAPAAATSKNAAAMKWLKDNPDDPLAPAVRKKLGLE